VALALVAPSQGTFLLSGEALGIPVSPFLHAEGLIVKHKLMEGGLGIHSFKNFVEGGDWIIQEKLANRCMGGLVDHLKPTLAVDITPCP